MSTAWTLYPVPVGALAQAFGHPSQKQRDDFLAGAAWLCEEDNEPDLDAACIQRMAARMLDQGISYAGLNPEEARAQDELVLLAFSPEGLFDTLVDLAESGPGVGLPPSALAEGRHRAGPAWRFWSKPKLPLANLLIEGGRRAGETGPSACSYIFFSVEELAPLAAELRILFEPHPDPAAAMQMIVAPVEHLAAARTHELVGVLR